MAVLLSRAAPLRRLVLIVAALVLLLYLLRTPTSKYEDTWRGHPPVKQPPPEQKQEQHAPEAAPAAAAAVAAAPDRNGDPKIDNRHPRQRLPQKFQEYLQWDPPIEIKDHYPPYDAYEERDHDPNRWERFPQNNAIYLNGTIKHLPRKSKTKKLAPQPYLPYPRYNSDEWLDQWRGEYVYCDGPRGLPYNNTRDDLPMAYMAKPKGYPAADVGSWEAVGLDENVCFDRVGRLGPYGLDTDLPASGGKARSAVAWDKVQWGKLQDECVLRNKLRYEDSAVPSLRPGKNEPGQGDVEPAQGPEKPVERPEEHAEGKADIKDKRQGSSSTVKKIGQKHKTRTAILIRTWDKYEYRDNDMQAVRSLIAEASLLSGGEYHVFLFVNVKNMDRAIFTDDAAYEKAMNDFVPEEFRSIAVLWNEQVCQEWYPKVGEWAVYWQQFMPLQWFSKTHPEFEYIWNWEMDARLIGQHYHFMEQVGDFAAKQPRKYLWERNARFFLPAVHGKYSKYFDDTNKIVKLAKAAKYLQTVWGPQPWAPEQILTGPKPPTSEEEDNFTWGVGEEADLLTLLPLWDPRETFWSYRDKLFNFPRGPDSYDERPYPHVPRRVFINTLARFSKKMLHAMHLENKAGLSMASEMWPGSVALQHGLKTVYAPHPIWLAQIWPGEYMDAVYNADGWGAGGLPGGTTDDGRGRNYNRQLEIAGLPQAGTGPNREGLAGRWSQERDAPYSPDREHNFGGWSWYFWSDFPKVIYWRWLGWKAGFSIVTIKGVEVTDELGIIGGGEFEREHGRMCLPPMLLHPVKNVKEPKPEVKEQEPKEEAKEAKEVKEQAKEPKEETKQPTEGEKPPSR